MENKVRRIRKIFETGEWPRGVDLEYTKNNPDNRDEECEWIRSLESHINYIINEIKEEGIYMKLINIVGFDIYQGPYATVELEGRRYKIWTAENDQLFIEDFVVDNQSEDGNKDGFVGDIYDIANTIIMVAKNKKSVIEKFSDYGRYNN